MQQYLSPNSKNFLFPSEKFSTNSNSSQGPEKNSPSQKSQNFSSIGETSSKKFKKVSPNLVPKHSQAFYKRSQNRSAFGRLPNQHHSSKQVLLEAFEKLRSQSVKKQHPINSSELGSPKGLKIFKDKYLLHLKPKSSKKTFKLENFDHAPKIKNKDPKFILDTGKLLFSSMKQHLVVVIANKGKNNKLAKGFAAEVNLVLQELDLISLRTLNYSKFCQALTRLRFIKSPFQKTEEERVLILKAWKLLGGYQESLINVSDFHLFLLIIMNIQIKIDPRIPNSPQNKKNSIWNLTFKELQQLREEFLCFYLNRTEPRDSEINLTESQDITISSEVSSDDSSIKRDAKEKDDEVMKEFEGKSGVIRKINLKELVRSSKSGALTWQSTSETPKNYSFRETSDEVVIGEQVLSPISGNGLGICRIQVKRVSTRLDDSKVSLDTSKILKPHSTIRFKFPEDLLSDPLELKESNPKSSKKKEL